MALDPKILKTVLTARRAKKSAAEAELTRRTAEVCREIPRIGEIDAEIRKTFARLAGLAFSEGRDPQRLTDEARAACVALERERRMLLSAAGYDEDYLTMRPACPACGDEGYIGATPCACLLRECRAHQAKELSSLLNIQNNNFDTFRMDCYSAVPDGAHGGMAPRENMEIIFDRCRNYAMLFDEGAENLLFTGATGLGKTFLSGCIAGAVATAGHSVVYDTAIHILSCMEQEKFGGLTEESRLQLRRIKECDLLILDDLGTEMATAFTQSAIYAVINDRLVRRKPTVISTNLSEAELSARYGAQTGSRLRGEYTVLRFFGDDIRQMKK